MSMGNFHTAAQHVQRLGGAQAWQDVAGVLHQLVEVCIGAPLVVLLCKVCLRNTRSHLTLPCPFHRQTEVLGVYKPHSKPA